MALTEEEERAAEYCRQSVRRREFQNFLAKKLEGSDEARRQLCIKTKPLMRGSKGDTSNDQK